MTTFFASVHYLKLHYDSNYRLRSSFAPLDHFPKMTRARARQVRATTLDDFSIKVYLSRIKLLVDSLASVGDPIPSQQHIDVIIEGLSQDYGSLSW